MKNMKFWIDANILLDVLQDRKPHVQASSIIWKLCESKQATGYISTLTFANLVYVMRKELSPEKINDVLQKLAMIFEFVDFTAANLLKAAEWNWDDFEDAVQSVGAERMDVDYIVTRNVKDFAGSRVMAFTPAELLARL